MLDTNIVNARAELDRLTAQIRSADALLQESYDRYNAMQSSRLSENLQQPTNDYYENEMRSAKKLQREINSLQNELSDVRSDANALRQDVNSNPARSRQWDNNDDRGANFSLSPSLSGNNKPARPDTIYLKDTVYLKDTLIVKDTLVNNVLTKDTIVQTVNSVPDIVFLPVETEKLVKEDFDHSLLPQEIVLFDIGKSVIKPVYFNKLDYFAAVLKKEASLQAIITGHTDKTGSAAVNRKLSEQRANAVAEYFKNKGVPKEKLVVEAVAASDPAVKGNSAAVYSQNRRVTIDLVKK